MDTFLFQASIYLIGAVVAVPIAIRFGLGSVLGYLLAGIVIGQIPGMGGEGNTNLQHFAEFGVVMMLFLIGLELEPRALWDMRHRLLGLGGLQVVGTMAVVTLLALALDQALSVSIALGMIFALSSTAIVLQTLNEKDLMQTGGGRSTFSVLLTQDIAVIPMLAFLPLLALPATAKLMQDGSIQRPVDAEAHGHHTLSLVEGLPGWGVTLVTLAAVGLVILLGIYAIRPLFHYINTSRLREMNTAFALLIVIGIAALMTLVGLSPALGTFLAGVVLANSEFRHELESDLEPFKGLLLGLFFITVGAGINFALFFSEPVKMLALTLVVMALKGGILYMLARIFNLRGRDRWLFTLGLAQAGEFGFVLVSFALQQNVLPVRLSETVLLMIALSMMLTPLFFIAYEKLSHRMGENIEDPIPDEIDDQQPIIIAGIGRFGQVVNRLVQMAGFKTTVVDHDLKTIQLMRTFGFKGFFGDPTRPELLHAAGLATARVLVVALDDKKAALRLVQYARRERPDLHIVARAHDRVHTYELFQAGANDIVREMFDSSLRAGRYVLENMGLTEFEANEMEAFFYHKDREGLKDLAQLWDPKIPVADNPAYVARAKELSRDLETALVTTLDEPGSKSASEK